MKRACSVNTNTDELERSGNLQSKYPPCEFHPAIKKTNYIRMNKHLTFLVSLVLFLLILSSCKKVVHLNLDTSSPQIVIQGDIYDHQGPYTVQISKSVNFYDSNTYPAVSGATVAISDNEGNSDQLKEASPGIYITSALQGVPGRTYTLLVNIDGQTYTASSTMPDPVEIATIYFQKSLFGNNIYPAISFKDPANINNYYRLIYIINNKQQNDINVTDDKLNAGQIINYVIRPLDTDNKLIAGDVVTIWLESIDNGVYEYFRTAGTGNAGNQSASPANPTSNISNGALGYFNACSVRTLSAIVP